jgi:TetR/AcrR family fatty acid metabolism transcriptional regulator
MPKKSEAKRRRIKEVALRVFAEKGFAKARISEIARQAGVADGTIYLYYKSKDDLLIRIFEEEMDGIIPQVRERVAKGRSAREKLSSFIDAHFEIVESRPDLATVLEIELRQSNTFVRNHLKQKFKEYLDIIAEIVLEGQQRGEIRPDISPSVAKQAVFGALDDISQNWLVLQPRKVKLSEFAPDVKKILLDGLCLHPAT